MTLKPVLLSIKKHKTFFILCGVAVWLLFFDSNSYLTHRKLNQDIEHLELQKKMLQEKIKNDKEKLEAFKTIEGKIKYGREHYYFKRDKEDIFLIEFDSI